MIGTLWRHKKRGSIYQIIGRSKMQISEETIWRANHGGVGLESLARTLEAMSFVTYRSLLDDTIWVRPETEFTDGRFERINV